MELNQLLSLVFGGVVVLLLAAILLFQWLSRKNTDAGSIREYEELRLPGKPTNRQAVYSILQHIYLACERVPLLRAYLSTIRKRLMVLERYDEWKLRLETIKIALAAWGLLAFTLIPLIGFVRDPVTLIMMVTGIWAIHGMLADLFVHRAENRLLHQLRHFMADVRHHYHRHEMVEEAVYDATETAPYEMALHGQEVYEVLTAHEPDERLERYEEVAPNRFLKGLAGISHLIKEYGDKKLQTGSLYLKALGKLTTELNLEILRREKLSYLLQGLTAIALFPMLFTKPIESWASHYFPMMDEFYAGKLGWITKVALLLVILVSYVLLRNMRELEGETRPRRRKPWQQKAYELQWVRRLIDRIVPHPETREATRCKRLLAETNSPLRLEWFWVQRATAGILAFLLTLGLFVTLHAVTKHQLLYAPVKPDMMFGRLSAREEAESREKSVLDRRIMTEVKGVKTGLSEAVRAALRSDPQLQREEEELFAAAQRILSKMEAMNHEYLKWWEVMLALFGGWVGYYAPVGVLQFRRRMRQMEMKHEVDQLQSVIAMLSEMDRMSVEHMLEWMERFAHIFKTPIQHCLLHYEHGAEQALENLKAEAPFLPFVRMVEKLQMAVERIPIRDAFDDLESEQTYLQEQRKQDYERLLDAKAGWGKMIGFAPMMVLIFGYLVFPLVYVSLSQMTVYYEQIQKIQ
ncbi:hypothetical protein U9M73_11580 [Paenibacillus phoenicis]|uniref:GTPase SAR1 n=1 Tax=Paenibacillus phoenicis TaxID=554117 RepID=A0ABU5PL65_9BACL|nr:hypothetical protein [Paenibacillus phoenicis]MEA3570639.1 hypothetical protein [Paenibacillus phoenicis]